MIYKLLCRWGFHKPRYWQTVRKRHHNSWVYKYVSADGCKCARCGKILWRRDYDKSGRLV